ncbi:MAG: hypothetical protein HN855_03025 [Anaerolineae bacterium]|nr:hypothetical protein [Anaerolineae bacterium]MBT7070716.1 hypothetical protein [Anaerolineae bacterium]MBT7324111.1 hypothetical protein [Anaerolineae bacterium]
MFLFRKINFKNPHIYLASTLGIIFAISVYGYGLIDFFPPMSKRIFLFTGLAGLLGFFGYYTLLEFWLHPQFRKISKEKRWLVFVWGGVIGIFLMFAGTSNWTYSPRYLTFLLPEQKLDFSILSSQNGMPESITVNWISTSLGDISYDSLKYQGWERKGDQLILTDSENNSLRWEGRVGETFFVDFEGFAADDQLSVSWANKSEKISVLSNNTDRYTYERDFQIPFYASKLMLLLITYINFVSSQ